MPRDTGANYTLPSSYLATTGQTIEATQHNAPLEDIASALTGSLPRNGSGAMQADLPMAGFKITGLANGVASSDAATKGQLDAVASVAATINAASDKATLADDDRFAITDSAASYGVKRVLWSVIKSALATVFASRTTTVTGGGLAGGGGALDANRVITVTEASQAEAEAGTASTVAMTPRRVAQAIAALGGGVADIQTFTSSGTWTKPSGAKYVFVQIWGGGGGGITGSGGSGGGYGEAMLPASLLASTQAVVVGAAVGSNTDGNTSSFAGLFATGGGRNSGTPGTSNCLTRETGGQGNTTGTAGGNTIFAGGGGGSGGGQSIFGGNSTFAPGGGGNTGGSGGARGQVIVTTIF